MKKIKKCIRLFLPALLVVFCFCCCKNDDEDLPVYDITGEWMDAYSDQSQIAITTVEFTPDGVFNEWTAYISQESNSNIKNIGSYTNNGKVDIVYSIKNVNKYYPRQFHKVWRIVNKDKYMLHVYDETESIELIYRKVIGKYNIGVGEHKKIKIDDVDTNVIEFRSCDDKIATVNNNGEIYAIKRGVTYIRVIASEGEFAIKVEVNDNDTIIDDYFVKFIGEPISTVISEMGDIYEKTPLKDGTTLFRYNVIDNVLKRVYFRYFVEQRVYYIEGDFLDDVDLNMIIESCDKKYKKKESINSHLHKYQCLLDEHGIDITINDEMRTLDCELLPNDFERFDGYITKSIDEVANWEGFTLDGNESGFIQFRMKDYKYIEKFAFLYDEESRDIQFVILTCGEGVNPSIIDNWYNEHYIMQNEEDDIIYSPTPNYMMSDYYIKISRNASRIEIGYFNRKIM